MVCEYIVPVTRQQPFCLVDVADLEDEPPVPQSIMTKQTIDTAILATCSAIRAEAQPIMSKKLEAIAQLPLRFQLDMDAFPDDATIFEWAGDRVRIEQLLSRCRGHWHRITQMPRAPAYPHHVEIAMTSGQSSFRNARFSIKLWHRISSIACSIDGSSAVYHKGTLPDVVFENQTAVADITFWDFVKTLVSGEVDSEEEQTVGDYVKVEEL